MLKKLVVVSNYAILLVWLAAAFMICIGIYYFGGSWLKNTIVALIFAAIGVFLYYKQQLLIKYLSESNEQVRLKQSIFKVELVFNCLAFAVGFLVLNMVYFRVFIEGFPVFD